MLWLGATTDPCRHSIRCSCRHRPTIPMRWSRFGRCSSLAAFRRSRSSRRISWGSRAVRDRLLGLGPIGRTEIEFSEIARGLQHGDEIRLWTRTDTYSIWFYPRVVGVGSSTCDWFNYLRAGVSASRLLGSRRRGCPELPASETNDRCRRRSDRGDHLRGFRGDRTHPRRLALITTVSDRRALRSYSTKMSTLGRTSAQAAIAACTLWFLNASISSLLGSSRSSTATYASWRSW